MSSRPDLSTTESAPTSQPASNPAPNSVPAAFTERAEGVAPVNGTARGQEGERRVRNTRAAPGEAPRSQPGLIRTLPPLSALTYYKRNIWRTLPIGGSIVLSVFLIASIVTLLSSVDRSITTTLVSRATFPSSQLSSSRLCPSQSRRKCAPSPK
jgi:hypothetical protein